MDAHPFCPIHSPCSDARACDCRFVNYETPSMKSTITCQLEEAWMLWQLSGCEKTKQLAIFYLDLEELVNRFA